jgi:ParB family chromosome partitioning protein
MTTKADHIARLLGTRVAADAAHAGQTVGVQSMSSAKVIDIARIIPDPNQPRKTFDPDDLALLAGSLRDHGPRDPVKVRWDAGSDRWLLIDGERRFRAAQTIGMTTLSAVIDQQALTSDRVLELQLIENAIRADLTPLESGAAYQQLMAVWNCSQKALAQRLHISESKVSRSLDALNLPSETKAAVDAGKVGVMSAVKEARRKPAAAGRRRAAGKPVRISTDAGTVVVTVKSGRTVDDVLAAAIDRRRRDAA